MNHAPVFFFSGEGQRASPPSLFWLLPHLLLLPPHTDVLVIIPIAPKKTDQVCSQQQGRFVQTKGSFAPATVLSLWCLCLHTYWFPGKISISSHARARNAEMAILPSFTVFLGIRISDFI